VICSKTETRSRGGRAHDREASCLEYSNNHALTRDNSLTLPPYGAVMVSNLSFPGTEIIRYTEKIVSHHRTTLGVSFRSACLSLRGINAGSPHVASRGNGKSGSTSLNEERGCPPINRCRATVRALRYLTTKLGPWCRVNLSNMFPNLVKITSLDGTLCAGNRTRVHTRPYLRSTSINSCEFRSDTIYVFSEGANLRAFKSLNCIFIGYIYFIVPAICGV